MAVWLKVTGDWTKRTNHQAFSSLAGPLVFNTSYKQDTAGIIGGVDFSSMGFSIGEARFGIGNFITAVIKFAIVAWVVFLLVKAVNKKMPKKEAAPVAPAGPSDNDLLKEILVTLKTRG